MGKEMQLIMKYLSSPTLLQLLADQALQSPALSLNSTSACQAEALLAMQPVNLSSSSTDEEQGSMDEEVQLTVKYLSSPKLLRLQLQDAALRRHFLVQVGSRPPSLYGVVSQACFLYFEQLSGAADSKVREQPQAAAHAAAGRCPRRRHFLVPILMC